jgi:hypothetical protein
MAKTPRRRPDRDTPDSLARARERQELTMRWVLLFTVVTCLLLSSLVTLIHGPPSLPFAMVQGTLITVFGWLVRRLFSV